MGYASNEFGGVVWHALAVLHLCQLLSLACSAPTPENDNHLSELIKIQTRQSKVKQKF
jgi:hypothetical protein